MNAEPVSSELRAGEREENSRALGMETRFGSEGWLLSVCVCVVVELSLLAKVSSRGFCPPVLPACPMAVPRSTPEPVAGVCFTLPATRGGDGVGGGWRVVCGGMSNSL